MSNDFKTIEPSVGVDEGKADQPAGSQTGSDKVCAETPLDRTVPETKPVEEPIRKFKGKIGEFFSSFRPNPPKDRSSDLAKNEAAHFYGHLRDQKKLDLGWIGIVIGHGIEKLGNIAFLSILICFGIIIGLIWMPLPEDGQFREKTTATLFSIITLALGYLFGKTTATVDQSGDKER